MTNELEPCPFCGFQSPELWQDEDRESQNQWFACCPKCGVETRYFAIEKMAVDAWNTRHKRTCKIEYQVSTGYHLEDDVISLSCGHEVYGTVKGWHPRFCEVCGAEVQDD